MKILRVLLAFSSEYLEDIVRMKDDFKMKDFPSNVKSADRRMERKKARSVIFDTLESND